MITACSTILKRDNANNIPVVSAVNRLFFSEMQSLPSWPVTLVLTLCIIVATGTSGYLLWTHLTSSEIAGCGSNGGWVDCGHVAQSRWALWLGVPVSLLALGIYSTMAIGLVVGSTSWFGQSKRNIGWLVVAATAFAAGLSGVWFVILQLLVLKAICLYCMIAHTCGLVAAVTMLIAAPLRKQAKLATAALSVAGFSVLVVGQIFTRTPETHRIERFTPPSEIESEQLEFAPPIEMNFNDTEPDAKLLEGPLHDDQSSVFEPSKSQFAYILTHAIVAVPRILSPILLVVETSEQKLADRRLIGIQGGHITLDIDQWPLSGSTDAKYVFVELFDYHCLSCRKTHQAIASAKKKLGEELAVVCLPIPITPACTPIMQEIDGKKEESCNLANLAVAVWRVDKTCFAPYHDWLFEGPQAPSYDVAKARAAKLVGITKLDNELASGIPKRYVDSHVEIYKKVGAGTIPKLMFLRTTVVGEYTSVDGLIELIRQEAK